MRNKISLIFLLALGLISTACVDDDSTLGNKFVSSNFRTITVDTCTVQLSTVKIDSMSTESSGVAILGQYSDDMIGTYKASSYIEYQNANFTYVETQKYEFDSLTIRFEHNGAYWGDTLSSLKVNIHELDEEIEFDDDGYIYNVTRFKYKETPIMTAEIPFSTDTLFKNHEVRLPDEMGKSWMSKIMNKSDDTFEYSDKFTDYFKGLAFIPTEENDLISSFAISDSSMIITLYYHILKDEIQECKLFFVPSSSYHYNATDLSDVNSELAALTRNKQANSSKTNYKTFVTGLPGFYTKIEFPYLNELNLLGDQVTITAAYLQLYPAKDTYNEMTPLAKKLVMYTADYNNVTQNQVTDLYGTEVQTGSLSTDTQEQLRTYYTFDMTSFISDQLGKSGTYKENIQLLLPSASINTSYQTVRFEDDPKVKERTKLTLAFRVYNSH